MKALDVVGTWLIAGLMMLAMFKLGPWLYNINENMSEIVWITKLMGEKAGYKLEQLVFPLPSALESRELVFLLTHIESLTPRQQELVRKEIANRMEMRKQVQSYGGKVNSNEPTWVQELKKGE